MLGGVGLDDGVSEQASGKWRTGTVGSSECFTVVDLDPGAA
jgi:hypothetical protein